QRRSQRATPLRRERDSISLRRALARAGDGAYPRARELSTVVRPRASISGNSACGAGHIEDVERSDADLWERPRAGGAFAFGLLYDRHARSLYNYCFRRVGNRETAHDLLSMTFLEAWRRRDKELPSDKVLPWLYGIATNVVRHQYRAERRFAAALRRLP